MARLNRTESASHPQSSPSNLPDSLEPTLPSNPRRCKPRDRPQESWDNLSKGVWKLSRSAILSKFGSDGEKSIRIRWLLGVFSAKEPDFEKALAFMKSAQRERREGPSLSGVSRKPQWMPRDVDQAITAWEELYGVTKVEQSGEEGEQEAGEVEEEDEEDEDEQDEEEDEEEDEEQDKGNKLKRKAYVYMDGADEQNPENHVGKGARASKKQNGQIVPRTILSARDPNTKIAPPNTKIAPTSQGERERRKQKALNILLDDDDTVYEVTQDTNRVYMQGDSRNTSHRSNHEKEWQKSVSAISNAGVNPQKHSQPDPPPQINANGIPRNWSPAAPSLGLAPATNHRNSQERAPLLPDLGDPPPVNNTSKPRNDTNTPQLFPSPPPLITDRSPLKTTTTNLPLATSSPTTMKKADSALPTTHQPPSTILSGVETLCNNLTHLLSAFQCHKDRVTTLQPELNTQLSTLHTKIATLGDTLSTQSAERTKARDCVSVFSTLDAQPYYSDGTINTTRDTGREAIRKEMERVSHDSIMMDTKIAATLDEIAGSEKEVELIEREIEKAKRIALLIDDVKVKMKEAAGS